MLCNGREMFVPLCCCRFTRNRRYAWRDDDCCFRMTLGNNVVDRLAIVRAICRHGRNVNIDLIKEVWHHRDVAGIIRRQFHRDDFMRISIDTKMQLTPSPARTNAVLLIDSFSLAVNLQPRAID